MENIQIINDIIVVISAIATWCVGKKWLIPYLVQFWNWIVGKKKEIDDNSITVTKEFQEIKEKVASLYENRIDFLLEQISLLQNQVKKNSDDVNELQNKIIELQKIIYDKSIVIADLKKNSCCVSNCKYRVLCEFKDNDNKIE